MKEYTLHYQLPEVYMDDLNFDPAEDELIDLALKREFGQFALDREGADED